MGITLTNIVISNLLVVFLTFSISIKATKVENTSEAQGQRSCQTIQQSCTRTRAFQCCEGLECIIQEDYPASASGICIRKRCKTARQFCGGIDGYQCCEGLRCVLDGDYPDSRGVCTKSCRTSYQLCGGINRLSCCEGLRCVLDGDYSDAVGVCMPQRRCQTLYESCGGISGLECCQRYVCIYDVSSHLDDGGVCLPSYNNNLSY